MAIVEVSEGQQRGEFWLCVKHTDVDVRVLVLTLEQHVRSVFQSCCWMLPAVPC